MLGESTGELPTYYADAAVIAYRLPPIVIKSLLN